MKRNLALLAVVFALTTIAAKAADSTHLKGWISDSMCGAKHVGTGAECVKSCIKGGQQPVFVDEANKAVWTIDNPGAVKDFYGDHVKVSARANDAKKSMHIESIAAAE